MSASWPTVTLGDVLRRSEQIIPLDPESTYKEVTVRINGKGVVERRQVQGIEIAADRRYQVKSGQFIISRIDARHGASGLIPDELDGAVVTNDFPLFDVAEDRLDVGFLGWMSKTGSFVELCKRASEGTTNRVRLSEGRFKALSISLPPLDEQRRIVARIEELAAKVAAARATRQDSEHELVAFGKSYANAVFGKVNAQTRPLSDVCVIITDGTHQTPRYVFDGAIFLSAQNIKPFRFMPEVHRKVSHEDFAGYTARNKPMRGDVLLTRVGAGIGEAAVVDQEIEFAIYVSLALIRPDPRVLIPEYLVQWLNSPIGRSHSRVNTLGKGHSQGNLNLNLLRSFPIPIPTLEKQRHIVAELDAVQAKINEVKALQTETAAELNALLPAILDKAFKGEL
jgi:type I restriction enzyme, S subunit